MKIDDAAWVAGFFEGEGNISFGQRGGVKLNVQQVNREPLDKLQSIFGGSIRGPIVPKNTKAQPYFSWNLSSNDEVNSFVWKIAPWLSEGKLSKCLDMIELKINMRDYRKAFCRNGHERNEKTSYSNNQNKIICRPCVSVRKREYYLSGRKNG